MVKYFDPAHVTDELDEGEEGNVNVRSVRYEGLLGGEGDSDMREGLCIPKHQVLSSLKVTN